MLTPLGGIQYYCRNCCTRRKVEVERCTHDGCPLWSFRTGKMPVYEPGNEVRHIHPLHNVATKKAYI